MDQYCIKSATVTEHKMKIDHASEKNLYLGSRFQAKLDINVMGTITGSPLLQFCVLVIEAWNVGQGQKSPRDISRSCQDEQFVYM